MKIIKFREFNKINENIHDKPEEYVKMALSKIKTKIEKMFSDEVHAEDIEKFRDRKDKKEGASLADYGVELQSIELSKYSKTLDSVKVIYSDDEARYDLIISIDLKDAVSTEEDKDFSEEDIKQCYIKFKKYDITDFNLIGELSKTIKISEIDEDFLISLKIDLDKEYGDEESDDLEIETNDE